MTSLERGQLSRCPASTRLAEFRSIPFHHRWQLDAILLPLRSPPPPPPPPDFLQMGDVAFAPRSSTRFAAGANWTGRYPSKDMFPAIHRPLKLAPRVHDHHDLAVAEPQLQLISSPVATRSLPPCGTALQRDQVQCLRRPCMHPLWQRSASAYVWNSLATDTWCFALSCFIFARCCHAILQHNGDSVTTALYKYFIIIIIITILFFIYYYYYYRSR